MDKTQTLKVAMDRQVTIRKEEAEKAGLTLTFCKELVPVLHRADARWEAGLNAEERQLLEEFKAWSDAQAVYDYAHGRNRPVMPEWLDLGRLYA